MFQQQLRHAQGHSGFTDSRRTCDGHQATQRHASDHAAHQRITTGHRRQSRGQIVLGSLQALEDPLRLAVVMHRGDKAITALRHIDDITLTVFTIAQCPAQRRNVYTQVDLFDHRRRPDKGYQLLLPDHSPGVFDQYLQNVQRPTAHA